DRAARRRDRPGGARGPRGPLLRGVLAAALRGVGGRGAGLRRPRGPRLAAPGLRRLRRSRRHGGPGRPRVRVRDPRRAARGRVVGAADGGRRVRRRARVDPRPVRLLLVRGRPRAPGQGPRRDALRRGARRGPHAAGVARDPRRGLARARDVRPARLARAGAGRARLGAGRPGRHGPRRAIPLPFL
ncbi:MAG: hypothetical protein AVDCRST_MAG30-3600, partial [uncultured Solirubrobacteraceae bacterium]